MRPTSTSVPRGLRAWFVIHFLVDISFAIPLLLFPVGLLKIFGWTTIDPLATRLVGAALAGIGLESFLGRNAPIETYRSMLRLKVSWSLAANLAIALSLLQGGAPTFAWVLQGIFIIFSATWIYYLRRL